MYHQPTGRPHVMTKLAEFLPPRNRHYPMDIAYCEAGPTITKAEDGMLGYVWKAFLRGNELCVKREVWTKSTSSRQKRTSHSLTSHSTKQCDHFCATLKTACHITTILTKMTVRIPKLP